MLGVVTQACNPSTWKADTEGSGVLRPAQDTEQDLEWEAGGGGGHDTGTRHSGTLFLTQHSLRRQRQ